jgi:hypothetical protein
MMAEYVVYRHGWSEANQPPEHGLPQKMPVARVEAGSADEACRVAARQVTLTADQCLSAEPAAEVDAKEHNLNLRVEALNAEKGSPTRP